MHPIFCKKCGGLRCAPTHQNHIVRAVRRRRPGYRLHPCHKSISLARLSWNAAVHYGIIDREPEGRPAFEWIGSARVVSSVLTDRLIPNGPRWSYT